MASGDTLCSFTAQGSFPPSSNYAALTTRNGVPVLAFNDTTQQTAYFLLQMPRNFSGVTGINVYLSWMGATATSGTIGWDVAFARLDDNDQDLDGYSFATAQTVDAATVNATTGKITTTSVAVTVGANMNGVAAGEWFVLRVRRDVANDNAVGDAHLIGGEVKET